MTDNKLIVQHSVWDWGDDYHIMTSDGKGFVRVYINNENLENIICDLFVAKEERGKGVATILLDKCDEILNGREVKIVPKEEWMREWYTKRGYDIVSKYQEPIDEEKLDELVNERYPIEENDYCSDSFLRTSTFIEIKRKAFKAGFYTAKEE